MVFNRKTIFCRLCSWMGMKLLLFKLNTKFVYSLQKYTGWEVIDVFCSRISRRTSIGRHGTFSCFSQVNPVNYFVIKSSLHLCGHYSFSKASEPGETVTDPFA